MGAREVEMAEGSILTIEPGQGRTVRIRSGEVWLTQNDRNDYALQTGQAMELNARGTAVVTANEPTLLELLRADPAGFRAEVERAAQHARADAMRSALRRIASWLRRQALGPASGRD